MRMTIPLFRVTLLAALCVAMCVAGGAAAATINNWNVAGGGSWNAPANWNPANVPTATEDATFGAIVPVGTATVTLDGNQTVYGVTGNPGAGGKTVAVTAGTGGTLTVLSSDASSDGISTFYAFSVTSGILTIAPTVQLGDASTVSSTATFYSTMHGSNFVFNGAITEAPGQTWGVRIAGNSDGIVNYGTTAKTYSGGTTIATDGILKVNTNEMIPNGVGKGNLVIEGAGVLQLNNVNETINGLSSSSSTAVVTKLGANTRGLTMGDNTTTASFAGNITNGGSNNAATVTKIGGGTQTLAGTNNTWNGATAINGGTLLMNGIHNPVTVGTLSAANGYTVAAAGTLGGTGTINIGTGGTGGNLANSLGVVVNGKLAPGASTGTLDVGAPVSLNNNSTFDVQLGGTTPGDGTGFYDQLNMTLATGSVNLTGTVNLNLSLVDGFAPEVSDVFYILTRADAGTFSTLFAGTTEGGIVNVGGLIGQITYLANWTGNQGTSTLTGGNDVAIYIVPEPTAIGLATVALMTIGFAFRRRR